MGNLRVVAGRILLATGVVAAPETSDAQSQQSGWYVGAEGGWSHLGDLDFTAAGTPFKASVHEGFAAGGSAGYAFRSGVRIEAEVAYRRHEFNSLSFPAPQIPGGGGFGITVPGVSTFSGGIVNTGTIASPFAHSSAGGDPTVAFGGDIQSLAFMANILYDVRTGTSWRPYVGVGAGAAKVTFDGSAGAPFTGTIANSSDWQFAYQGIAGIAYGFASRWSASLDYRYFATIDPSFHDVAGNSFKIHYHTQNVMLGLTYHLVPR